MVMVPAGLGFFFSGGFSVGFIFSGATGAWITMMAEGLDRIRGRLAGDVVEYFIVGTGWWERFQDTHALPAREVFRIRGSNDSGSDGLVVFTNSWNRVLAEELEDGPLKPEAATVFSASSN